MIYSHPKPWIGYRMVSIPTDRRAYMTYGQFCAAVLNWRRLLLARA